MQLFIVFSKLYTGRLRRLGFVFGQNERHEMQLQLRRGRSFVSRVCSSSRRGVRCAYPGHQSVLGSFSRSGSCPAHTCSLLLLQSVPHLREHSSLLVQRLRHASATAPIILFIGTTVLQVALPALRVRYGIALWRVRDGSITKYLGTKRHKLDRTRLGTLHNKGIPKRSLWITRR